MNRLEVLLLRERFDVGDVPFDPDRRVQLRPLGDDLVIGGEGGIDAADVVAIEGVGIGAHGQSITKFAPNSSFQAAIVSPFPGRPWATVSVVNASLALPTSSSRSPGSTRDATLFSSLAGSTMTIGSLNAEAAAPSKATPKPRSRATNRKKRRSPS